MYKFACKSFSLGTVPFVWFQNIFKLHKVKKTYDGLCYRETFSVQDPPEPQYHKRKHKKKSKKHEETFHAQT